MKKMIAMLALMIATAAHAADGTFDGKEVTDWSADKPGILAQIGSMTNGLNLYWVTTLPSQAAMDISTNISSLNTIWATNADAGATFEPSGLWYDQTEDRLYVIGDDGGVAYMATNGNNKVVWQTRQGKSGTWWNNNTNKNDFEAVTKLAHGDTNLFIGAERFLNTQQSCIIRANPDFWGVQTYFTCWNIATNIESGHADNGALEALTYIPSNDVPTWVTNPVPSQGLFLAGNQNSGKMYLLSVPLSDAPRTNAYADVTTVASWFPTLTESGLRRNDCSDIYWDHKTRLLYMLYDEGGEGGNDPASISGQGMAIYVYDLQTRHPLIEWRLPTGTGITNPEGITTGPYNRSLFLCYDSVILRHLVDVLPGRSDTSPW